jgi:hypothetical protein
MEGNIKMNETKQGYSRKQHMFNNDGVQSEEYWKEKQEKILS